MTLTSSVALHLAVAIVFRDAGSTNDGFSATASPKAGCSWRLR